MKVGERRRPAEVLRSGNGRSPSPIIQYSITIGGTAVFDSTACDGIRGTSYPLSKALVMPCRDEMSKRINFAFAVTERKENRTLREKSRFAGAKRFAL